MNEKIYYNEDLPEGVEPLYNGNIADVYYSAHDSAHFRLSYDGLNRLTASQQYTRDGVKTAAAEAFTYDKMGNITSIVRSTQNPQPDYITECNCFMTATGSSEGKVRLIPEDIMIWYIPIW